MVAGSLFLYVPTCFCSNLPFIGALRSAALAAKPMTAVFCYYYHFFIIFFYNPISSLPFNLNQMPPVLIFRQSFFISFFLYDFQVRLLSIFRQFSMIYGPIFNDYWPLQLDLLDAFWLISSKVPGLILNQIWSLQSNEYFCRSHQLLMFFLSIFSLIFSIAYHFCSMLSINFCSVLVSF